MRFVRRLFTVILLSCLVAATAVAVPSDSLKVRWINGHKFLLHKVLPKETWTSVAKKYSTTIQALQAANPGVSVLKISQIINIPAAGSTQETAKIQSTATVAEPKPAPRANTGVKYHTVKKGETLYRISKEYGLTIKELQELNGLTSSNVPIGKKLKVSDGTPAVAVAPVITETPKPEPKTVMTEPKPEAKAEPKSAEPLPVKRGQPTLPVTTEPVSSSMSGEPKGEEVAAGQKITENGVATWIADSEMNQNKFYALHRTAPVGTIIKVTNRMNNNSVFVKVIGVLPATGDNENVLIKITQAAAQRIGALDQRFQAELSYAAQ